MVLLAEAISSATAVDIGLVVVMLGGIATVVAFQTSTKHRLDALEKAQEADNKWRQEQFQPWRQAIDLFVDRTKRATKQFGRQIERIDRRLDPDAAQSRATWEMTDDNG